MTNTTQAARGAERHCMDNCGATVAGFYKQGHDAKHVSLLAKTIISEYESGYLQTPDMVAFIDSCMAALPSERLQYKLRKVLDNYRDAKMAQITRAEAKAAKKAQGHGHASVKAIEAAMTAGEQAAKMDFTTIKIGRWTYAVRHIDSLGEQYIVTYLKKDGTETKVTVNDLSSLS